MAYRMAASWRNENNGVMSISHGSVMAYHRESIAQQ
jgi:hypothetical protein